MSSTARGSSAEAGERTRTSQRGHWRSSSFTARLCNHSIGKLYTRRHGRCVAVPTFFGELGCGDVTYRSTPLVKRNRRGCSADPRVRVGALQGDLPSAPKFCCSACQKIVQAAAPSRPIKRGLAGPELLALAQVLAKVARRTHPERALDARLQAPARAPRRAGAGAFRALSRCRFAIHRQSARNRKNPKFRIAPNSKRQLRRRYGIPHRHVPRSRRADVQVAPRSATTAVGVN